MSTNQISVNPSLIARVLGGIVFILVVISIIGQLMVQVMEYDDRYRIVKVFVKLFDVNGELNIPTYYSTLLLILAAVLLATIVVLKREQKAPYLFNWVILSLGFFVMAADESYSYHEKLTVPVRAMLGGGQKGVFYFAWVIPAIALVFILALFFLKFLLHLPMRTRGIFIFAASLYLSGAIGMELIESRNAELYGWGNFTFKMMTNVEEGLEMGSINLFIWELLNYIATNYKEVNFSFVVARV
jgi:hypothetical protein